MLIVADLELVRTSSVVGLAIGVFLWGLHMGFTQGLCAALVADTAPLDRRGTAFGMFNLLSGLARFCASLIAGALWDTHGPSRTFFVGAVLAVLALVVLILARRRLVGLSPTMANERVTNPPDMR